MVRVLKELKDEMLTVIQDTREQRDIDLSPMKMIEGTLTTGDFSLAGLTNKVSIEVKTLEDMIGCVGRDRDRFNREVQRLNAYPCRLFIIEGSKSSILLKQYRGNVHPNAILGSLSGWQMAGLPIYWSESRKDTAEEIKRCLRIVAQRYWSSLFDFVKHQLGELDGPRSSDTL